MIRRGVPIVVAATVAVAIGGAGAGASTSASTAPPPSSSASAVYPLTGLPLDPTGPAQPRPAMAVVFDNYTSGALPQIGLNEADIVLEVIVEGQTTRPTGVFNSHDVEQVGPIRSARSTDYDLLGGLNNPILVTSGTNQIVGQELATSGFTILDQHDGLYRDNSAGRSVPHNLFGDTAELFARGEGAGDAVPLFDYDLATPDGRAVTLLQVLVGGQLITWDWDADQGVFLRSQPVGDGPHETTTGQVSTENVVVVVTTYQPSTGDANSPQATSVGTGTAVVYRDGTRIDGTWTRPSRTEPFVLTDASGVTIPLAPGRTWVEFVDEATHTLDDDSS